MPRDRRARHKRQRKGPDGLQKPFRVSADLFDIIGTPAATRLDVMRLIWQYVKANDLQDPLDKRYIYPDFKMQKIWNFERMRCHATMKGLEHHLIPFLEGEQVPDIADVPAQPDFGPNQ